MHFVQKDGGIEAEISLEKSGVPKLYHGKGNGRSYVKSNALKRHSNLDYTISTYEEHALKMGSNSQAWSMLLSMEAMEIHIGQSELMTISSMLQ